MTQADCRGTQISEWSRDGERLFTRVELQCADRPARAVSGISLLANGQWIEAQATLVDGNHDVRVRRYRRAAEPSRGIVPVASPLSIEDIIEASKKVQSHALEAALDEAGGRYTLNSRVLTQLADGGVSPNVIDLMVAQSYPDRFRVERDTYRPSMTADTGYTSGGGSTSVFSGSSTSVFIGISVSVLRSFLLQLLLLLPVCVSLLLGRWLRLPLRVSLSQLLQLLLSRRAVLREPGPRLRRLG
jgi:hypothetical protein